MWDRLLSAGGTVSKAVTQRIRDVAGGEEHESDDDSEGVDTHTIRALREYYVQKGRGIPTWLGGDPRQNVATDRNPYANAAAQQRAGEEALHRQMSPTRRTNSGLERAQTTNDTTSTGRQKVSLRGIYEQAQSRDATAAAGAGAAGQPRRAYSSARSAMSRFESDDRYDAAPSALPSQGAPPGGNAAGSDRFKNRMRFDRTVSSNAADVGGSYGPGPASSSARYGQQAGYGAGNAAASGGAGRVSAEYSRPETGASQLRRANGLPSRPSQRRI